MPLGPGTRLDSYEIVCPLGSGGMADVWLATELRLGRKVALKILPAELTRDPIRVQRFEQEARAASALNHPNVCTIHALGETPEGQHYIAMELVEGETLRHRLSTRRLGIGETLEIAIQIAAALSAAHRAGIIHRDIKPENVMLRPDGLVKVLDFGLAKLAPVATQTTGRDTTQTALRTEAGVIVGTTAYMSPEQARGQEVDARTDIWSLGILLSEMVVGRSPFAGPTATDVLAAILEREPAPLVRLEGDVPAELQRIVTKSLRRMLASAIRPCATCFSIFKSSATVCRSPAGHLQISRPSGRPVLARRRRQAHRSAGGLRQPSQAQCSSVSCSARGGGGHSPRWTPPRKVRCSAI